MTIASNKAGKKDINSLCITMSEAKFILFLYLMVAIVGYLYKDYSLYNILIIKVEIYLLINQLKSQTNHYI